MGILFQGGTIITASEIMRADLLVEGEIITQMGVNLSTRGHEVVKCQGKYLMPGGIDVHTHLELPFGATTSNDDFDNGHRAAAFGGTTTHIDFATQPRGGTLAQGLARWQQKARPAQIDYAFHMAISDPTPEIMNEIPSMLDAGITSLKVFMAYKNVYQIDDAAFFKILKIAAGLGMLVMVHAENGDVEQVITPELVAQGKLAPRYHAESRPAEIEEEATNRAVMMAGLAHCPLYVVHMTCAGSVEALRRGRARGLPVMGETCVQYFYFTAEDLARPGFEGAKFVCSPPLRTKADQAALWRAIQDGTLQVISTDHCNFWYEGGRGPWQAWTEAHGNMDWGVYEKQNPEYRRPGKELGREDFRRIPNGLPGLHERMLVTWEHGVNRKRISSMRFVEVHSTNPAKIFGLYPRKGTLAPGSDADILVWNPKRRYTLTAEASPSRTDYILYEGWKLRGKPQQVYLRGRKIVDGEQWLGENGYGRYLARKPGVSVI